MPANESAENSSLPIYNQRGRAVEAMALDLLRKRGYSVVRSTYSSSLVQLVAWDARDRPVLIHVKRTRHVVNGAADVIALWPEDIAALQALPRGEGLSLQVWVSTDRKEWWFFEVFPGGITEVED
jgi:Holliday junction resolvase